MTNIKSNKRNATNINEVARKKKRKKMESADRTILDNATGIVSLQCDEQNAYETAAYRQRGTQTPTLA